MDKVIEKEREGTMKITATLKGDCYTLRGANNFIIGYTSRNDGLDLAAQLLHLDQAEEFPTAPTRFEKHEGDQ